jgi:tetratricopeptide (TPR) repeat protein
MFKLSRPLGSLFQSPFTKTTGVWWTAIVLTVATPLESADRPWILMKSAHFEVISNASEGSTRNVTWQLEQIRAAVSALWPWARVDLTQPLSDTLTQVEQHAKRATDLNNRFASAYSLLAEARSALDPKTDSATPLVRRAIALEPLEPGHRLTSARVLWRRGNYADALAEARAALALSRNDQERAAAQDAIRGIEAAAR